MRREPHKRRPSWRVALEMVQEDAFRRGNDPATGPADLRDLADRLSEALELGRTGWGPGGDTGASSYEILFLAIAGP